MWGTKHWNHAAFLASLILVAANNKLAFAQQKAGTAPARAATADDSKTIAIEPRVKNLVAERSAPATGANPKVEPGKVRWHPSFAAACIASQKSGKPVLLFHLMGKLDDQFC